MRLEGRRESENVEDRRRMGTGTKIGLGGIGGLIIAGLITLLMGGNIGDVLQQAGGMAMQNETVQEGEFSEEEQELATFSKQVIASTEDIWSQIFREYGIGEYPAPTLVLYTGTTQTACGQGNAAVGPFYCSGDQKVYLDLSFFQTMDRQLGVKGDNSSLAKAYVIAHEVGHHIEYLMGTLDKAHQRMQATNQTNANKYSVRLELMADFYAGVWAHYESKLFGSISDRDLQEAAGLPDRRRAPRHHLPGKRRHPVKPIDNSIQNRDWEITLGHGFVLFPIYSGEGAAAVDAQAAG